MASRRTLTLLLVVPALLIAFYGVPAALAESPALKWSITFNSPISPLSEISNGIYYVGSWDGYLYKFQTAYKRPDWKYPAYAGVMNTPAYQDGTVYFGAYDGQFYAVETKWGTQKWKFKAGNDMESGPLLYKDTVVFVSGGKAYALDKTNGTEVWNRTIGKGFAAWLTDYDFTIYASSSNGNVTALDPYYGGILWQARVGNRAYAPLAYDGNVYVGTSDDTIIALDHNTGAKNWSFTTGGLVISQPVAINGMIYAGAENGYIYALNANNGSLVWKYRTGGPIVGSPAVKNWIVYAGSGDGHLYALSAFTGNQDWAYNAGSPINSTPVIGDGRIYFSSSTGNGSGSRLYALTLPGYIDFDATTSTPVPSSADTGTATEVPEILPETVPETHAATAWCPVPGIMAAFIAGTGLLMTYQHRRK